MSVHPQQHQGSSPHPLGVSINSTGEGGLHHTGFTGATYEVGRKHSDAARNEAMASAPSVGEQGGTEATLIAAASSHDALQHTQQQQQQHHCHTELRGAMLGSRSIAQADIAAFAAQAAQAAHADHAVAMLRKKQMTVAVTAAENAALEALQHAKESSKRQQRSVIGGPTPGGGGGGSGAGVDRRGGGARAAYCLIPQPFHSNNNRDLNNHRGEGMSISGGESALGGGRSVGGHISTGGGLEDHLGDGHGGGGRGFEPQRGGVMVPAKRGREDSGILGDLNHGAGLFGGGGGGGTDGGSAAMSAECRLERSREQNRQSSRKARMRRKGEEMSLKDQIESIQVCMRMLADKVVLDGPFVLTRQWW